MYTANIPLNNAIPNNNVLNTNNEVVEVLDSIAIYEHFCKKKQCHQVLTLNLLGTTPAHLKGWELVKQRELITVGISIGNGYFNRERIEIILMGMASYFKELIVIVPDLPALHTYRALGYDEHQAIEKMKKHRQEIKRHCRYVSEQMQNNFGKDNMRILAWSDGFNKKDCYQRAYHKAVDIFRNNSKFKEAISRNTERYILARLEDSDVQQLGGMRKIVEIASHYLIEEMAFHEVFHVILGKEGISSYYKDLELIPNYINGAYNNVQNPYIGWIVYNIIDSE